MCVCFVGFFGLFVVVCFFMPCKEGRPFQRMLNSTVNLNITSLVSFLVSVAEKIISIRGLKEATEYYTLTHCSDAITIYF